MDGQKMDEQKMEEQRMEAIKQSKKKYYEKKKQNEEFQNKMNERRRQWVAEHKTLKNINRRPAKIHGNIMKRINKKY